MKQTTIFGGVLLLLSVITPSISHALSCVDPQSMLEYYVEDQSYVVFSGVASETVEHIKQSATDDDPNRQFNEGYTAQLVEVNEVYKGTVASDLWLYHQQNSTWGYVCSSGPVKMGEEMLFIISDQGGYFELPTVVNTYSMDSDIALQIEAALTVENNDPQLYELDPTSEKQSLSTQIREMIFLIRIKLAEWRSWSGV